MIITKKSAFLLLLVIVLASGLDSCIRYAPSAIPSQAALPSATSFPADATFEGRYTSAFEVSVFYPCSMQITEEYVEGFGYRSLGYWLSLAPESGFQEQFQPIRSQVATATDEEIPTVSVFVRFVGTLSPTRDELGKGYGHMGLYTNELIVTKLLEMKPWEDALCQ